MFKRYKLYTRGKYYFTCQAYCAECKGLVKCWCFNYNPNEALKMFCRFENVSETLHHYKIRRPLKRKKELKLEHDYAMEKWPLIGEEGMF